MSGNFYSNWQPDDKADENTLDAWRALAGESADPAAHESLSNTVQLPEMNITAGAPDAGPVQLPEPTDPTPPVPQDMADPTPFETRPPDVADAAPDAPPPPPMSATARLGQSLSTQDDAMPPDAPAWKPSDEQGSGSVSPWAVLADTLLNRGKGLGTILSEGSPQNTQMRRAELDLKRAQAEHLRAPVDPATLLYKQQMLDLQNKREGRLVEQGDKRLGLSEKNLTGVQSRFDLHRGDVNDPTSQHNQTQVTIAGQKSGATTQSRLDTEHSLTDRTAEDKAALAAAETAARIGATHDLAPVTSGDAASQAEQVAAASQRGATPGKLAYESSMNPILADRQTNGVGQGLSVEGLVQDNPGLQFNDPEQIRRAMRTRTISSQTLDKLQASNRAREILGSMYKTIEDFQKGDKSPEAYYGASKQLDSHAQEYAGMMGRIAGSSTQEQVRSDAARVPSLLNPYALTGVKKLWEAADANIKGNLGTLGITAKPPDFTSGNGNGGGLGQPTDAQGTPGTKAIDTTNPTPSAGVAKGDYANYSHDTSDPNKLPTAAVPPLQGDARGSKRMYVVTKPNGKTVNEELSPEEANVVRNSQGWSIR